MMRHAVRQALSVSGRRHGSLLGQASAHAPGLLLANPDNSRQPFFLVSASSRPPGRPPLQLLAEPGATEGRSGLAEPARRRREDDSDWPSMLVGALALALFAAGGGTDIPEGAAASAEPV